MLLLAYNRSADASRLQKDMRVLMSRFDCDLPCNPDVRISRKASGWLLLMPLRLESVSTPFQNSLTYLNRMWNELRCARCPDHVRQLGMVAGTSPAVDGPFGYAFIEGATGL